VDETYLGGLEEGVRGRQTDSKALIVVAAQGVLVSLWPFVLVTISSSKFRLSLFVLHRKFLSKARRQIIACADRITGKAALKVGPGLHRPSSYFSVQNALNPILAVMAPKVPSGYKALTGPHSSVRQRKVEFCTEK
jgi:hypothetical protein